jgi:hypothetical protein
MRRFFICFVLVAAFAVASTIQHPVADAQGAKKAKDGVIEIREGKDGKFRFTVRDGSGKLLAMSGPRGFATEKDAHAGIDALKEVLRSAKVIHGEKKETDKKDKKKEKKSEKDK